MEIRHSINLSSGTMVSAASTKNLSRSNSNGRTKARMYSTSSSGPSTSPQCSTMRSFRTWQKALRSKDLTHTSLALTITKTSAPVTRTGGTSAAVAWAYSIRWDLAARMVAAASKISSTIFNNRWRSSKSRRHVGQPLRMSSATYQSSRSRRSTARKVKTAS